MARGKKTISVDELIDIANEKLSIAQVEHITTEFKMGVCAMIEKILHSTNRYNGFYFQNPDDCEFGTFGYFSRKYFK